MSSKIKDLSNNFIFALKVLNGPMDYEREHKFHPVRKWRFDLAWTKKMVAVECDGIVWQAGGGRHNTDKDREKINTATSMGWRVLRFSGRQIKTSPKECVNLLKKTLEI
jgi:very-short-patch-repair endonuclease